MTDVTPIYGLQTGTYANGDFQGFRGSTIADKYDIIFSGNALQPGDIAQIHDLTTDEDQNAAYIGVLGSYGYPIFENDDGVNGAEQFSAIGNTHPVTINQSLLTYDLSDASRPVYPVAYPACYVAGTLIAGEMAEFPIERLNVGDKVKTLQGEHRVIRWIGRRSYKANMVVANAHLQPIRIKAGALAGDMPKRDLLVSPAHAMMLDGLLISAESLVNGKSIVREKQFGDVHYFHIELDTHDVIWAEGAPSETYQDVGNRDQFANGWHSETLRLAKRAARNCYAPRVDNGLAVDAVRRRLNARVGISRPVGQLRGHIDGIEPRRIRGWAQNVERPEVPVCLDLVVDGVLLGRTLANKYRADLQAHGLGSGRHAFDLEVAMGASPRMVEVRRSIDHVVLGSKAL